MRAYLDHAATTPMRAEAVSAMLPYLCGEFGNPSGSHLESRRARHALDAAREQVAVSLGADFGDVVFTAGGTEADNLAVVGGWDAVTDARTSASSSAAPLRAIVCSAIEHHAVLRTCRDLAARSGLDLREVPSDKDGVVDLDQLADTLGPEVGLVSVMTVNNEVGTVQPIDTLVELVRRRAPLAVVHTDAVQAVPWLDPASETAGADLVSISGHKFGGPKGVGALVARRGTPVRAVIHGGGQERERRSGTHNVAGVVAMASALGVTTAERGQTVARVRAMRDRLGDGLVAAIDGFTETGERAQRVAGMLHVLVAGVDGQDLVVLLDESGVAVSAGAACASGAVEPSHVLAAMGRSPEEASGAIRFSLGATTTDREIDHALAVVPRVVRQLRG